MAAGGAVRGAVEASCGVRGAVMAEIPRVLRLTTWHHEGYQDLVALCEDGKLYTFIRRGLYWKPFSMRLENAHTDVHGIAVTTETGDVGPVS